MAVGFVGGANGALTALPSTAMVIWSDLRGQDRDRRRGTLQPVFLTLQVAALVGLAAGDQLDLPRLLPSLLAALPALVLGCRLRLYTRAGASAFRRMVLGIVMASGALMVAG